MNKLEIQQEALSHAVNGQSVSNYAAIFEGFSAMGIPMDEIRPRETVFTYNAWRALNRHVKRGEHGVRVTTVIRGVRKNKLTGNEESYSYPRMTTVFHVSQTEADETQPTYSPVGVTAEMATA